jgi:serine-type D-Ala-D-Ala carboxypeptidase (penicillin-binding protein 5/6)
MLLSTALAALLSAGLAGGGAAGPGKAEITAASYVAVDRATGHVLVAKADSVRRPIASLTKVMTALVVAERGDLGKRVTVTPAAVAVEPSVEGLVVGRRYRRITLLYSSLLVSSNDSATALAIDAGDGSLARFYELMNSRASSIGMTRTTYASASGLDDLHNRSTALDQARLARSALDNPTVSRIVDTRTYRTRWARPTYAKVWVNHNKMLGTTPGVFGVKTGWTTRAGGCLMIAEHRNGRDVIAVLLDSASIWTDMSTLLDRAFAVEAAPDFARLR